MGVAMVLTFFFIVCCVYLFAIGFGGTLNKRNLRKPDIIDTFDDNCCVCGAHWMQSCDCTWEQIQIKEKRIKQARGSDKKAMSSITLDELKKYGDHNGNNNRRENRNTKPSLKAY